MVCDVKNGSFVDEDRYFHKKAVCGGEQEKKFSLSVFFTFLGSTRDVKVPVGRMIVCLVTANSNSLWYAKNSRYKSQTLFVPRGFRPANVILFSIRLTDRLSVSRCFLRPGCLLHIVLLKNLVYRYLPLDLLTLLRFQK